VGRSGGGAGSGGGGAKARGMWSRLRRRLRGRAQAPLDLAAVDRLGDLVSRIVTLIPEAAAAQEPEPAPEPPPERAAATLLFVPSPAGYGLTEAPEGAPGCGGRVELAEGAFRVLRLGPSPLPGDSRRCAFLEREEPSPAARTPDR
jgi:hypothetical protein